MQTSQLNVEYFFRKLYELIYGADTTVNYAAFTSFIAHVWNWIIAVGYLLAVVGLFMIVYTTVRLFELRKREEEYYHTLVRSPESDRSSAARWQHIESLVMSTDTSKWREAIIEADIMLDDVLFRRGYEGDGVSEKLKSADSDHFRTLQDAWEAHKVRNQIAHEGSAFNLSESIVRRTIARYESVFHEFDAI